MGVRSEQLGIVRSDLHSSLEPMAVEGVISSQLSDVFQAFKHACMPWRQLIGDAESSFCPIIILDVKRCQTQTVGSVCIQVQGHHVQTVVVEDCQQTA